MFEEPQSNGYFLWKDPETRAPLNVLLTNIYYALELVPEIPTDFSNLSEFMVIPDETDKEMQLSVKRTEY